jgi:hypothetical protein
MPRGTSSLERGAMIRDIGVQRILNVDLTSGRIWREEVEQEDLLRFLGGRGINAKLLYERVPAGIDPLGPGNVLIFGLGTLTGTSAPSSGRTSVTCKGPETGLHLKVSVGGHLGAELKYAGHDYVAIHGRAEHPMYLWIDDEAVELRDARHLWGLGTREADRLLRGELGDDDVEVGLIGPAGESVVLFACNYNNLQVNELIQQRLYERDARHRLEMSREAQRMIMEDAPWALLSQPHYTVVTAADTAGYALYPDMLPRYRYSRKKSSLDYRPYPRD